MSGAFQCRVCRRVLPEVKRVRQHVHHVIPNLCMSCNNERAMADYQAHIGTFEQPTVSEKWCPACDQTLPADAFNRSTRHGSGLQTYCRECNRQLAKGSTVAELRAAAGKEYQRSRSVRSYRPG